jgi:hypothetical protein
MTYKARPIHEGGDVAKSMAAMCRQFNISPEHVKLEVSFSEGKCLYHLEGRASAYFSFDEKAATYEEVEIKAVRALEQWHTHGLGDDTAPKAAAPARLPATSAQRDELLRFANHPLITRQEKTNIFLNINKIDMAQATEKLAKFKQAIKDRENIQLAA